jgi:hypothetical protein
MNSRQFLIRLKEYPAAPIVGGFKDKSDNMMNRILHFTDPTQTI